MEDDIYVVFQHTMKAGQKIIVPWSNTILEYEPSGKGGTGSPPAKPQNEFNPRFLGPTVKFR